MKFQRKDTIDVRRGTSVQRQYTNCKSTVADFYAIIYAKAQSKEDMLEMQNCRSELTQAACLHHEEIDHVHTSFEKMQIVTSKISLLLQK